MLVRLFQDLTSHKNVFQEFLPGQSNTNPKEIFKKNIVTNCFANVSFQYFIWYIGLFPLAYPYMNIPMKESFHMLVAWLASQVSKIDFHDLIIILKENQKP